MTTELWIDHDTTSPDPTDWVCEVYTFNRDLSDQEINIIYAGGLPAIKLKLEAWWIRKLDAKSV